MQHLAETERIILAAPDGTMDSSRAHFWNATDNCCNFENKNVDDVAYLVSLVDEIDRTYGVDRTRVFAVGHSNGGGMAMRLACDVPDIFSAVVSIAGPGWQDESKCQPKKPVSVRHMHGTRDGLIYYDGGAMPSLLGHHPTTTLPPAQAVAQLFATRDGCDAAPVEVKERLDLDNAVPGEESHTVRWEHCKGNASVELVTMDHVGHMLWKPTDLFAKMTWDFLRAHPGGGR
jgi:polyhydroxybutyrate depolymerase